MTFWIHTHGPHEVATADFYDPPEHRKHYTWYLLAFSAKYSLT